MDFDQTTTAVVLVGIVGALLGGTLTSPMTQSTKMMVAGGQVVFLLLTFVVGVRHGQYRATA